MLMMKDVSLLKTGATGERLYNKVQDFMWDEVLFEYISFPQASHLISTISTLLTITILFVLKVVDIVENFTGPNIMAMHTMLINKPPDAGSESSRHPLHQVYYI
jgi:phytanoyl-CoA hydroxylase